MSCEIARRALATHHELHLSFKIIIKQADDGAPWPPTLNLFIYIVSSSPLQMSHTRSELCRTEPSVPQLISSSEHVRVFESNFFVACCHDSSDGQNDHIELEARQLIPGAVADTMQPHAIENSYALRASAKIPIADLTPHAKSLHIALRIAGDGNNFETWHLEISTISVHCIKPSIELESAPLNSCRATISSRVHQMWTILRAVDCIDADIKQSTAVNGDAHTVTIPAELSASSMLLECSSKLLHNIDYRYFSLPSTVFDHHRRQLMPNLSNLIKRLSLATTLDEPLANSDQSILRRLSLQDTLIESPTCYRITCQFLRTSAADCASLHDILSQDDGLLQVVPELSAFADGVRRLRQQLHAQLEYLTDNAERDLHFKPSRLKTDLKLSFLPTNLHLHYTNVLLTDNDKNDSELHQMRLVTVGAFAAHALKFNHGGMLRLLHDRSNVTSWLDHCARIVNQISQAKTDIDEQLLVLANRVIEKRGDSSEDNMDLVGISDSPINVFENVKHFVMTQYRAFFAASSPLTHQTSVSDDSSMLNEFDLLEWLWNLTSIQQQNVPTAGCLPRQTSVNSNSKRSSTASLPSFCSLCMNTASWDESLCCFLNNTSALHAAAAHSQLTEKTTVPKELLDAARNAAHKLLDTLCVSFGLFCSGFHGTTNSRANAVDNAQLVVQYAFDLSLRYATVMSQAISSLASALTTELLARITLNIASNDAKNDFSEWIGIAHCCGLLLCFESLLSCYGAERGMLEDFAFACEQLMFVECEIVLVNEKNSDAEKYEIKSKLTRNAESGRLRLLIKVPKTLVISATTKSDAGDTNDLFEKLKFYDEIEKSEKSQKFFTNSDSDAVKAIHRSSSSGKIYIPIRFHPVLFNVGINETATLAETLGNNELENTLNRKSAENFGDFVRRRAECLDSIPKNSIVHERHAHLTQLVDQIQDECRLASRHSKARKVQILKLAAEAARSADGIRFTSCKSAKDRTAMSVTLEQCEWLNTEFGAFGNDPENIQQQESRQHRMVNVLRTEGVRLRNVMKNIGAPKYAFSQLQLLMFPEQYRPPADVCSKSVQT